MTDTKLLALNSPLFVVGPLRSGTTLLRLMIGNHKDIYCFGEFEFAVSRFNGISPPSIEDYVNFLSTDRQALAYKVTVDETIKDYNELVRSFLRQLYERQPNKIVGASLHSRMDVLPQIWPNGKFIHLLRDPRDVARSCIGMGWVGNVFDGAKYWIKPEKHWDALKSTIPKEQLLEVRYESLVSDPESELRRICEFLGLPFDPNMVEIENHTSYSKPNAKFAYQWKSKLSEKEIAYVESQCWDLMIDRQYELFFKSKPMLSSFDKLIARIDSRFSRIKFGIDRYGFKLWFTYGFSKWLGLKKLNKRALVKRNEIQESHLK